MDKHFKNKLSELNRMKLGLLYSPEDPNIQEMSKKGQLLTEEYNTVSIKDVERRQEILGELFYQIGENVNIRAPFHVDYGSQMIIGDDFFANFDCIFLDVSPIVIGNNVMLGPRVGLYTATHPLTANVRNQGIESGQSILIEDNVWIGGGSTINPGVIIGENSIVASGSVVTKNVPRNTIVGGTPARVLREINENDHKHWNEMASNYYFDTKNDDELERTTRL